MPQIHTGPERTRRDHCWAGMRPCRSNSLGTMPEVGAMDIRHHWEYKASWLEHQMESMHHQTALTFCRSSDALEAYSFVGRIATVVVISSRIPCVHPKVIGDHGNFLRIVVGRILPDDEPEMPFAGRTNK